MYINLNHAFDNRIELPEELLASAKSKRYAKGDILYNKGDGSQNLVYIKSGIVGLVDLSSGGHESLLRVFGDHFLLGYRSFLAKESYHATAMGLTDGELLLFPYQTPEELLEKLPKLYMHIGQMLARDLRIAEERFNDITGKRVMSRIIESLIFLKHRHPSYQWTRREIGEFYDLSQKFRQINRFTKELYSELI